MDNLDAGSDLSDNNFVTPEVIEPQYRCKKRHSKRSASLDHAEMGDTLKANNPKEKEKSYEEKEIEFLGSLKNCTPMKVTTDNVPNLGTEQHGDWVDKFVPLEHVETLSEAEEKSQIEHKYRNVYSISNQMKTSSKTPEIDFDLTANLHLSKEIDAEEKQNFLCNMHRYLVEYQEARGTPRTEYPYAALIQEMGQITGRCMLALFEVVISLSPLLQIFLYILRFILDRIMNIQETNDYYQMSVKYLILGVQVLSVFFCIGFIFGFIVLPILQMGATIIAKILFYE